MAIKPIFIIKTPTLTTKYDYAAMLKHLEGKLTDYYVLLIEGSSGEYEFECFYEKDIKHTNIEELKQIILDSCAH